MSSSAADAVIILIVVIVFTSVKSTQYQIRVNIVCFRYFRYARLAPIAEVNSFCLQKPVHYFVSTVNITLANRLSLDAFENDAWILLLSNSLLTQITIALAYAIDSIVIKSWFTWTVIEALKFTGIVQ
jgi:hypothetical protein